MTWEEESIMDDNEKDKIDKVSFSSFAHGDKEEYQRTGIWRIFSFSGKKEIEDWKIDTSCTEGK